MKIKKTYLIVIVIVVLFLFAGVGAYLFSILRNPDASLPGLSQDQPPPDVLEGEGPDLSPIPLVYQVIMDEPPPDASRAALQQYRANIEYYAQEANNVSLTDCLANPAVIKVVSGSTISLKNNDSTAHTILVNPENTFEVGPGQSVGITADFGSGLGIYSYTCDNIGRPVGVFLVRDSL